MKLPIAIAVLTLSTAASAQLQRDSKELRQDANQKVTDKIHKADDVHDLIKIDQLIARFDRARANHNERELRALDEDVRRYVKQELVESHHELRADVREVHQSQAELASDRQELRKDRVENASASARVDDRIEKRDDRRDLRDDKGDAAREARSLEFKKKIAADLEGLYGRVDPKALDQKRFRMVQLDRLSRGELVEDNQELREDRKETREDLKKTREDVRH